MNPGLFRLVNRRAQYMNWLEDRIWQNFLRLYDQIYKNTGLRLPRYDVINICLNVKDPLVKATLFRDPDLISEVLFCELLIGGILSVSPSPQEEAEIALRRYSKKGDVDIDLLKPLERQALELFKEDFTYLEIRQVFFTYSQTWMRDHNQQVKFRDIPNSWKKEEPLTEEEILKIIREKTERAEPTAGCQ